MPTLNARWGNAARLAAALLFVLSAGGFNAAAAEQITLEPGSRDIPAGQTLSFAFETTPPPAGQTWAVSLEARAWGDSRFQPGGTGFLMDVRVNDRPATGQSDRLDIHLRNRPLNYLVGPWYTRNAGWRVPTTPSFDQLGRLGAGAASYVIDIGHLLKPGANRLLIRNLPAAGVASTLTIRDLRLVLTPRSPRHEGPVAKGTPPPAVRTIADGSLLASGGGLSFPLSSSFSIPGGGWTRIGPPVAPRPGETQGAVVRGSGGAIVLRAEHYRVERSTTVSQGRILVRDRIVNQSAGDLGMMIRHELSLPSPAATVRLAGNDEPAQLQIVAPFNPTLFAPLGDLSLALVAEDDVFRQQAILSCNNPAPGANGPAYLGLRTERLVVPAGESVTLQWSLYALRGDDYFDFVNRVRNDWGVRLRLDGPYWWNALQSMPGSDDALADWVRRRRVFAAVIGSWIQMRPGLGRPQALGAGVMDASFANYHAQVRDAVARIRRLAPGVKIGLYNHLFFNAPQTSADQHGDSRIIAANGQPYIETFSGRYSPAVGVYPTTTNSFGADLARALDSQIDMFGVDGFYFDESNHSGLLRDPVTYGAWDRRSGILDPRTFAMIRKIGYIPLLSADYETRLYAALRRKGMWLLGNDQPHRMADNRDTWPRFTETDALSNAYRAHLYSPLAFTYDFDRYTMKDLRERLELGVIYAVTGPGDKLGVVDKFFPITPTEIHSGWIQGEERIITMRSGSFGWSGRPSRVRIWRYAADGALLETDPPWRDIQGRIPIATPDGGIAVMERETR